MEIHIVSDAARLLIGGERMTNEALDLAISTLSKQCASSEQVDDVPDTNVGSKFKPGGNPGNLGENLGIILCKDCRYRDPEDKKCDHGHGIVWQLPRPDDWFCADGKA